MYIYLTITFIYGRVMTITLLCIYTCTLYMYQYSSRNKREKNVGVQLFYEGYEVKLVYALIIINIQLLCHQFHTL